MAVIPYVGNDDWVEDAIKLQRDGRFKDCPPHSEDANLSVPGPSN